MSEREREREKREREKREVKESVLSIRLVDEDEFTYCALNILNHFQADHLSWSCRLQQQKTPTASPQRVKTPPMSVLDMTLNNMMARLQ